MFCEYCGKEIKGNEEFCPHCGMAIEKSGFAASMKGVSEKLNKLSFQTPTMPVPKDTPNTTNTQASGPIDIVLAEGETIVKKYNCANVKGVKGYLTVTNKRLLFNASGGSSRFNQEVTLSSVSGFTCYKGTNVNLPLIIIGIIVLMLGIMTISGATNSYMFGGGGISFLGIIIAIIGGVMIFLSIRTAFLIAVYAKDVSLSPIVVGEGPKSFIGNSALFAIASTPTEDTDTMLSELGALVQDLQGMGDLAIEKWQNRISSRDLPSL